MSRIEPLHYFLCKTGKSGCDTTCTHQYLSKDEIKKQLGWREDNYVDPAEVDIELLEDCN